MKFDRLSVKSRLRKEASRIWEIPESQMDGFDPVVDLLLGACAVEFEKVSEDIQSSETRILKRLVQLMTPEVFTGPKPAHAILHARPYEPKKILKPEDQLFCLHRNEEVFFSPLSNLPIVDGAVQVMATGTSLFRFTGPLQKEKVMEAESGNSFPPSVLWVGLYLNAELKNVSNLSLFFDWKNKPEQEKAFYYQLLPASNWFINNVPVETKLGLIPGNDSKRKLETNIYGSLNISSKIEEEIFALYRHSFLTLGSIPESLLKGRQYPEDFESVFAATDLQTLTEELLWLEVHFPESIPGHALSDLYCALNCVPVVNRRLHLENHRLEQSFNIVPLRVEDSFLDVQDVTATNGDVYTEAPLEETTGKRKPATFTTRRGGVHKFDARDASEMLTHVLNLLRDESAAFSAFNLDAAEITLLNQAVARMERNVSSVSVTTESVPYVFVNSIAPGEDVTVRFWSTKGEAGNRIPGGAKIQVYGSVILQDDSLLLVSSTYGGRNVLSEAESLHAYRKSVLTHERVVTAEDIKAVCYAELGNNLADVEVKPGFMIHPSAKKGFVRTIDVHLKARGESKLSVQDWQKLGLDLQYNLQSRSSSVCPIQVMV